MTSTTAPLPIRCTLARIAALRYAAGEFGTAMPTDRVALPLLAAGLIGPTHGDAPARAYELTDRGRRLLPLIEARANA